MEIFNLVRDLKPDHLVPFAILYIGPETMLPLASALAAIAGVLLMFWQRFVGLLRKLWGFLVRKKIPSD